MKVLSVEFCVPGKTALRKGAVLLACLGVVSPFVSSRLLSAQSPAQRDSLDALEDSLAGVTDTIALAQLERDLIGRARLDRNNAMLHLRLGLTDLRLGALGRRNAFDDAAGEFQWAGDLQPDWPWPWYGMGRAEYGILDSEVALVAGLQAMFGRDRLTRAAGMFAKSAEVDPTFVRGLTDLSSTTLEQRINLRLAVALEALRRSAKTAAGRDPRVLLARGRVEREVGDPDSSIAALRSYLAVGGDSALGALELARSELGIGRLEGTERYFAAAGAGDTVVDAMIRADLVDLVGDTALAPLDSLRGAERRRWLTDFWTTRDLGELRRGGERIAEHYRRLLYARKNFRLVSPRRQYRIEERYRSYNRDYDDRGIIYIRHGEPTDRVTVTAASLPLNQSWKYARPEGDLLFHFVAREDVQDYKLVESLYDILGFDAAISLRNGIADTVMRREAGALLQSRERLSPIYGRLISAGGIGSPGVMDRERLQGRRSIATGTGSDSYSLRFTAPLEDVKWHVQAAGSEQGRDLVHLSWAVPGRSLRAVESSRGSLYPVRVRFSLVDPVSKRIAASVDSTTFFLSSTPVPPREWLVGRITVPAPPGRYVWRVSVEEGEAGMISAPDTVVVPLGNDLAISDLVIGTRLTALRWFRSEEDTVYFNPTQAYRNDAPLELFFEVFGVRSGVPYQVEIKVSRPGGLGPLGRIFGGGGTSISLREQMEGTGERMPIRRSLDLGRLKPGNYTLEVTVDRGGRKVRERATFQVVGAPAP